MSSLSIFNLMKSEELMTPNDPPTVLYNPSYNIYVYILIYPKTVWFSSFQITLYWMVETCQIFQVVRDVPTINLYGNNLISHLQVLQPSFSFWYKKCDHCFSVQPFCFTPRDLATWNICSNKAVVNWLRHWHVILVHYFEPLSVQCTDRG